TIALSAGRQKSGPVRSLSRFMSVSEKFCFGGATVAHTKPPSAVVSQATVEIMLCTVSCMLVSRSGTVASASTTNGDESLYLTRRTPFFHDWRSREDTV